VTGKSRLSETMLVVQRKLARITNMATTYNTQRQIIGCVPRHVAQIQLVSITQVMLAVKESQSAV